MAAKKTAAPRTVASRQTTNPEKQSPADRRSSRRGQAEDLHEGEEDDPGGETLRTDLGPWAEPSSTRVKAYRYDYLKRETQVTWVNNNNPGYAYPDMSYEDFRRFARIASKGKYINRVLNGLDYRRLTSDEVAAPSNRQRRGVSRNRSEESQ